MYKTVYMTSQSTWKVQKKKIAFDEKKIDNGRKTALSPPSKKKKERKKKQKANQKFERTAFE